MVDLSICILTYNNASILEECINSIISNTQNISYEIIIVDGGSTDNTLKLLTMYNDVVTIINNKKFSGFSAGNNQAFRIAKGEFILMLNDDTIILNNSIEIMFNYLKCNNNIGAVGPRIYNTDKSHQYSSYLTHPTLFYDFLVKTIPFYIFYRTYRYIFESSQSDFHDQFGLCNGSINLIREVKHLMGCCIMFRLNSLKSIGYMDENFYLSLEDQDFCARISQNNLSIFYLSNAEIIHHGGQSTKKLKKFSSIFLDSRMYFETKYYGKNATYFYKIILILSSLINLVTIPIIQIFTWDKKYKSFLKNSFSCNFNQLIYILRHLQ